MSRDSMDAKLERMLNGCKEDQDDRVIRQAYAKGGAVLGADGSSLPPAPVGKKNGGNVDDADYEAESQVMKTGGKIHIKKSHEGDLSRKMGVPVKDNIPMDRLKAEKRKAEKDDDEKLVKQTTFAINAKKWKK